MKSSAFYYAIFCVVGIAVFSCSKTPPIEFITSSNYSTRSSLGSVIKGSIEFGVSEEEGAAYIAMHYPDKSFNLNPVVQENDTLLYICNFDSGGWALLAGDKRSRPILGDCETDYLSIDEAPEGIHVWIDSCCDEIKYWRHFSNIQSNSNTDLWNALFPKHRNKKEESRGTKEYKWGVFKFVYPVSQSYSTVISHLIGVNWGQSSPWNTKLPIDMSNMQKCPTGCSAVAIAQLLYYTHFFLGKPTGLYHSIQVSQSYIYGGSSNIGFSRDNYESNSSRWGDMPIDSMPPGDPLYVEDLMLDIGNRLGMNYSGTGSGAWPSLYALSSYYSLSGYESNYQENLVRYSLEDEMPVVIVAFGPQNGDGGHTWLIDGLYRKVVEYEMMITFEYSENWVYADEYYDTFDELRQHYHTNDGTDALIIPYGSSDFDYWLMNWGYDGTFDDGHYSISSNAYWNGLGRNKHIYYGFY